MVATNYGEIHLMKLSLIVPNINRGWYLDANLYLLTQQTMPTSDFEVIIMDDDSTDDSLEIARKYKDKLNLSFYRIEGKRDLPPEKRYSSSVVAQNFAIRTAALSDICVHHDPEICPLPEYLEELYNSCQKGYEIKPLEMIADGVAARYDEENRKELNSSVSEGPYFYRALCLNIWREHIHMFGGLEDHDWKDIVNVWNNIWKKAANISPQAIGMTPAHKSLLYNIGGQGFWEWNGMTIPKAIYLEIGGYQEENFALGGTFNIPGEWGGDDTDLWIRINNSGRPNWKVNPNAKCIHRYHPKPMYNPLKFERLHQFKNRDDYVVANLNYPEWGLPKSNIKRII